MMLVFPFLSFPRTLVAEKAKLLEYKYTADVMKMEGREDQQSRHSNDYGKTIKGMRAITAEIMEGAVHHID